MTHLISRERLSSGIASALKLHHSEMEFESPAAELQIDMDQQWINMEAVHIMVCPATWTVPRQPLLEEQWATLDDQSIASHLVCFSFSLIWTGCESTDAIHLPWFLVENGLGLSLGVPGSMHTRTQIRFSLNLSSIHMSSDLIVFRCRSIYLYRPLSLSRVSWWHERVFKVQLRWAHDQFSWRQTDCEQYTIGIPNHPIMIIVILNQSECIWKQWMGDSNPTKIWRFSTMTSFQHLEWLILLLPVSPVQCWVIPS